MVTTNSIFESEAEATAIEVDMVEVIAITRTSQVIRTSRIVNLTILRSFRGGGSRRGYRGGTNIRGTHRGGNAGNSKNPLNS